MGNPLAESWIYATVMLQNESGGQGTGFLVIRRIGGQSKMFVATNKHILGKTQEAREAARSLNFFFNVKQHDGTIKGNAVKGVFDDSRNDHPSWREHPARDVDVLAIDVTTLYRSVSNIANKYVEYNLFGTKQRLDELDVTIGDDVMVVGYPLGLRHHQTNFPLLRAGVLATKIGETLEDEVLDSSGKKRRRVIRGFLIDGAMIPGSSGSPVVLKPIFGRKVKDSIMGGLPAPILLGIVAEAKYAPVQTGQGDSWSYAGLGLAFDAETVKETIELFFQ
jgi:hypothetical protein